jgi:hypothetical protein
MKPVSMWRWLATIVSEVASAGSRRKLGSPRIGFLRSISMSNGSSPRNESPAVESRATRACASGFASGLHGISPANGASGICEPRAFLMKVPAKRQGSYSVTSDIESS